MDKSAIRLGVCRGGESAAALAAAGGDYIELSVAGDLVPDEDESVWAERRQRIAALPLPVEAFNGFVRTGKITGPDADFDRLTLYVNTALGRAAEVGGKIIVFGSGGPRAVPAGFERAEAERQIVRFLERCADASDRTGVVVVIEPLNRAESNILNSVAEGARFVREVDRPGIRNLADTYHMEKDGESLGEIVAHRDSLAHVHTADTGRGAPGTGVYDHVALFRALRAANYRGRVSLECDWTDFDAQVGPALAHLRRAFSESLGEDN